jgi:hypothetical protein
MSKYENMLNNREPQKLKGRILVAFPEGRRIESPVYPALSIILSHQNSLSFVLDSQLLSLFMFCEKNIFVKYIICFGKP